MPLEIPLELSVTQPNQPNSVLNITFIDDETLPSFKEKTLEVRRLRMVDGVVDGVVRRGMSGFAMFGHTICTGLYFMGRGHGDGGGLIMNLRDGCIRA